jgi:hypothetical protein
MFDAYDRTLSKALEELGHRIHEKRWEFHERGEFSNVHADVFETIEGRRAAQRCAVGDAIDHGRTGSALVEEARADVDALVGGFEWMLFSTAAAEMRAHRA